MELYQLVAPSIALYYIIRIIGKIRRKNQFVFTSTVWLCFWISITVLSIIPHEFSVTLSEMLGFKNNINTIIFIALGFLIVLSFYLSSKTDKLESQVTDLVRQLALDERRIKELENKKKIEHNPIERVGVKNAL